MSMSRGKRLAIIVLSLSLLLFFTGFFLFNITLDSQGFTIDGDDTGTDYGVYASGDAHIWLQNCNISDFAYGFFVENSVNSSSLNNTFFSNSDRGTVVSGSNNFTSNNSLYVQNTVMGFEAIGSDGAIILNNTFLGHNTTLAIGISFAG